MHSDNEKVSRYADQVAGLAVRYGAFNNPGVADGVMRSLFRLPSGIVSVRINFYRSSMRVAVVHSVKIAEGARRDAWQRMKELNGYLSDGMQYAFAVDGATPAFSADYPLRKTDPLRDAGLEGFCELIFRTVPSRLCDIADTCADNVPERTPEPTSRLMPTI